MDPNDYDLAMSPIPESERRPNGAMPDELVVSLEHLRLVTATIDDVVGAEDRSPVEMTAEKSHDLGLALLKIPEIGEVAGLLAERVKAEGIQDERYPDPGDSSPIDRVIWALRTLFRHRYAGWTPVLGKNRLIGRIHGVNGVILHTGDHSPEKLTNQKPPPARESAPGQGVRVGLLDTGLYPNGWLVGGWDARFGDMVTAADPYDVEGHATFIAGLILSQAPGATVKVRRVLNAAGEADGWSAAKEIVRLGAEGVDVLNLSFACYTSDGEPPLVLATAIDRLDPSIVVVAAAGNHGDLSHDAELSPVSPAWPAALDEVIAVGAVDEHGDRARWSPDTPWVDIHARGENVVSTFLPRARKTGTKASDDGVSYIPEEQGAAGGATEPAGDGWAIWSGTSFAAGLISGAIAAWTRPGSVTSRAAITDILTTLSADSSLPPVGRTSAKYLNLPDPGTVR
jgi:hypothetical protein